MWSQVARGEAEGGGSEGQGPGGAGTGSPRSEGEGEEPKLGGEAEGRTGRKPGAAIRTAGGPGSGGMGVRGEGHWGCPGTGMGKHGFVGSVRDNRFRSALSNTGGWGTGDEHTSGRVRQPDVAEATPAARAGAVSGVEGWGSTATDRRESGAGEAEGSGTTEPPQTRAEELMALGEGQGTGRPPGAWLEGTTRRKTETTGRTDRTTTGQHRARHRNWLQAHRPEKSLAEG